MQIITYSTRPITLGSFNLGFFKITIRNKNRRIWLFPSLINALLSHRLLGRLNYLHCENQNQRISRRSESTRKKQCFQNCFHLLDCCGFANLWAPRNNRILSPANTRACSLVARAYSKHCVVYGAQNPNDYIQPSVVCHCYVSSGSGAG